MTEIGQLAVDFAEHRVYVSGVPVDLTVTEFDVLATLVSQPGRVFSRSDLIAAVPMSRETVTEIVRRLRNKLALDPARSPWIQTVRGCGYRLERRHRG